MKQFDEKGGWKLWIKAFAFFSKKNMGRTRDVIFKGVRFFSMVFHGFLEGRGEEGKGLKMRNFDRRADPGEKSW